MNMLALVLTLVSAPLQSSGSVLHIRSSAAFAPCIAPVVTAYSRESGVSAVLDEGLPHPAGDADVVIGDDPEMTRLLEGGTAILATSIDLGFANALVSLSRAGAGEHRRAAVRPLIVTAAEIAGSRNGSRARGFLAFLDSPRGRPLVDRCFRRGQPGDAAGAPSASAEVYGRAVLDWWLPQCSLTRNGYNNPQEAVGPPDAANLGGRDNFRGLISLGQGGYVTLELGEPAVDGPGPDIRVFQAVTGEPVSLYASNASQGPFVLLGLRRFCGTRTPGVFSNHCDFDLRDAALATARYVKVEDGEIYPCLAGGTLTEGADLDAVQVLNR